ncbi:Conserved_hypothetical protein [Hexamita inflata]|uniref:Transmembrane protein n=1 Tax=Hexamita inflata TaxID=28002 RepID=A0AA86TIS6_9EUKA|nr:Conserved hypothetical protein [Hexamita inflata]
MQLFIVLTLQYETNYQTAVNITANCYTTDTEAILVKANSSICFNLVPANNTACALIPHGVHATVRLNKLVSTPPIVIPDGYIYNFSYGVTNFFCVPCADPACASNSFWQSEAVELTLSSMVYQTVVTCGKITRSQADRSFCVLSENDLEPSFESNITVSSTLLCYYAALSNQCPDIFTGSTIQNATVTIQGTEFVFNGTSGVQDFVVKNGTHQWARFCFSGQNYLTFYQNKLPLSGQIQIFVLKNGINMQMIAQTSRIGVGSQTAAYTGLSLTIGEQLTLWQGVTAAGAGYQAQIDAIIEPKTYLTIIRTGQQDISTTAKFTVQAKGFINFPLEQVKSGQFQLMHFVQSNGDTQFVYQQTITANVNNACYETITVNSTTIGFILSYTNTSLTCSYQNSSNLTMQAGQIVNGAFVLVYTQKLINYTQGSNIQLNLTGVDRSKIQTVRILNNNSVVLEQHDLQQYVDITLDSFKIYWTPIVISCAVLIIYEIGRLVLTWAFKKQIDKKNQRKKLSQLKKDMDEAL